ncbi:MAG TPA: hypothetical protein VMU36_04070 [Spirochaetia bacterium]|nr:hypothetical protein [Spirochaetia bacterium]
MEESEVFLQQLTEALAKRRQWLEAIQLPRLKDACSRYRTQFESAMGTLIKKGLLREDPYNYEQSVTDIIVPNDGPLPEFESADETSYRLAAFRRQLKFIVEGQEFNLDALKLARLKKLSALLSYINWHEFGEKSSSPTTRAFARVFMKVLLGPDAMSAQILKDQETQIVKTFNEGRSIIADLVAWHRESWKAEVRRVLLPRFALDLGGEEGKKEEILRTMRKEFAKDMDGQPWYPALAQELVAEELEIDGASRKAKLLASLVIPEPTPAEKSGPQPARPILMEAVRIVSRPHEELITAVESLSETERLLQPREGGLGYVLRRLFGLAPREKPDAHTYEIQYSEPAAGTTRTEKVSFPQFADETRKKATLLAAIAAGTGPAYKRLVKTPDTPLSAFLDKQLNELLLIHRRLAGFNTLFQNQVASSGKQGVRGIKLELLAIRNSIVKANQRRHEYGERAEAASQKYAARERAAETSPD